MMLPTPISRSPAAATAAGAYTNAHRHNRWAPALQPRSSAGDYLNFTSGGSRAVDEWLPAFARLIARKLRTSAIQ